MKISRPFSLVFAAIASSVAAMGVSAQSGPPVANVNIVNPLPLPVTGNVSINGSVSVAQQEPFQVGTPGVGINNGSANWPLVTVPAGKRLVIEGVSAIVVAGSTANGLSSASIGIANTNLFNRLVCHQTGATSNGLNYFFSCATQVKMYVEAGQTVSFFANTANSSSGSFVAFASGYYVTVP